MKPIKVRSLIEADPSYATAIDLRQRLRAKVADLDAEESRLLERLAQPRDTDAESAAVAALLGDEVEPDADLHGPRARLRELNAERNDARRALEIAEGRLRTARIAASRIVVDEVKDEYAARVRKLGETLVQANEAHESLLALISDFNRQDIAWSGALEPMQANNIFGDRGARVEAWLRSARKAGYIVKEGAR